jgi:polar amino acid transport system substrate-binding protein
VRGLTAALLGARLLGAPGTVGAQAGDLAPTGALRVAVTASPALATRDPATEEWRGPWIDLARALAARLGVPVAFVAYTSDADRDAGMARGEWDVAASADTPDQAAALGRAVAVPFVEVDNTLVVGPASAIRSIAEADRPGVRIGATAGSPPERALSGLVTRAEIVRVAANPELVPLLASGQVEALASNRPNVLAFAAQVPGARVLADRFAVQPQRLTLAPGRSAASLALASDVTRQALASGLIRAAIERYGVAGVQVPPLPGGLPRTGHAPGRPGAVWGAGLVLTLGGLLVHARRRPGP